MLGPLVFVLVSLRPFSSILSSVAVREDSPWFQGCVDASDASSLRLYAPEGPRDLDPVTCSVRCLDEGFWAAALTSETCHCSSLQPQGPVTSQCLNSSSSGRSGVTGQRRSGLHLPVGGGRGTVAVYRTEGPFLHSVRLSASAHRVRAGRTFVVQVSGNLAGRPDQPTGILGVGGHDLSYVTVEFVDTTPKGQSSRHHVSVLDDGSFVVSRDWILETPGKYEINVSVSNLLSTLSSTLQLSVLQLPPDGLVISVLHGPLGAPCRVHPQQADSAYLGAPVALRAHLGEGRAAAFCWRFIHEKSEENEGMEEERKAVKTVCFSGSDSLNSSLNWTFETEGIHRVSVNASGAGGWTQQTIRLAVVRPAVSDLKVSVSRTHLRAGECVDVSAELFSSAKQPLVLNLALNAGDDPAHGVQLSGEGTDVNTCSSDMGSNISTNCGNHSNIIHQCNGSIPLLLLTSGQPTCLRHLRLRCRLPTTAGRYHLTASVSSAPAPSSPLLSTVLPQAITVYEYICALRPSGSWVSMVPTRAEFSLEVVSRGGRMGTRTSWTFSLDDAVVLNRTTDEWSVNVSLPLAGRYTVTVKAFNPVSWTSFQTHILAQDRVGELMLNVPSAIRRNQKQRVSFSVAAGSNVTVSLLADATVLHRDSSCNATGEEAAAVLLLNRTGTVVVELRAENRVSSQNKSVRVCVEGNRKPSPQVRVNSNWQPPTSQAPAHSPRDNAVQIYAAKQAYPTNTDVTFLAVADVPDPVEFTWHFGDSTSARTTSRTVTKRYHKPGRFDVAVVVSGGGTSITSEVFPLVVQRAVRLNRLVHQASVLQNRTVTLSCRVNAGTDLAFFWSFGDGPSRLGQSTEQHVFHRTGEFRVEVTVSNLVSSASLSGHVFVVDRPCRPPPVKNMGPLKLQVRRYEVIRLGVTYETEIDCDTSGGLRYTWTLFDSAGHAFPLPLTDTHRQSLTLHSHLLHYGTYTAVARVQVVGSVVYSNYSVRVQVTPSPPVAFIQGGTNVFINNRNTTVLTLDGQGSHDPDFPMSPLSYSWTCKPLSSIATSCFNRHVPTSSPVLTFPVRLLKHSFDQFRFALTVHSGGRSASSETFLTVTPHLLGKLTVHCPHCRGDQVNWDRSFSVGAVCEDCDVSPKLIQFTWTLHLVNASSRPVTEVPFCYTVDLGAPSSIIEGPAIPAQTPAASTLPPPDTAPVLLPETASKTRARTQNLSLADASKRSRNVSDKAGADPAEHHPSTEHPTIPALEQSGVLFSERFGQGDVISDFPIDSDSSADWEFSVPVAESGDEGDPPDSDYDVPFPSAEEGDPGISAGRPTGVDGETLSPGDDSVFDPAAHEVEGSNLVVSRPSVVKREPTLLDLPRDPVDRGLFESYTYTGISSSLLRFRPFSLRPGSRYMLEVTAKSHNSFLGRTQLFFKAEAAPGGVTCQVQPVKGTELHTHFSIFCSSGKEDLLYEHSFSVGGGPPKVLYQGRDFQYFFSLPSGDPSDDYKVTIYTEIRSGTHGTATKPCPVTVRVQPSFLRDASSHRDPDVELSGSGLRNLSALMRLGNSREIRNYIGLLSSILNRLSLDSNTPAQRHMRSVLICTVCELESSEQASLLDSICTLKDLLQIPDQVTLPSVRRVTVHVQAISDLFLESSAPVRYHLDHKTLNALVALLSHTLQAAVTNHDFTPQKPNTHNNTTQGGPVSAKQKAQLVGDILRTASDLILKYILFHKIQEHRVSTGLISLYAASQNRTSAVISGGSSTFYLPASLIRLLAVRRGGEGRRRPCVLSVLTELAHGPPYTCARRPTQLSAPVVDLSLYKCGVRRKIPVRSLPLPIDAELHHPPRNKSSALEYILLRTQVSHHGFNITQDHLQQSIQLSVAFAPPPSNAFPIMLLFRMFERPTPSMHHVRRVHHWESNTIRITLPPSYLNAAGVGHLALLNADFGKAPRRKHLSEGISYSLSVVSSLCLSWDDHQGAWTHRGCRTRQADATPAVNCSCHQLRPLTVVQHQIHGGHDTSDLDPFLSVSRDLTVLGVLVLCACLFIPGLVACKRADAISEKSRRVHYLPDNPPSDPYLYAVTVHTGLCSAASMSAKVYIVLYGEDGFSHTRELQVPGCTLFRRNSKDTFILSTADSLGPVWGVHIWHDNSGPSPNWFLKQVEVSEANRGDVTGRAWLFVGQSWLAVGKGDGQVERLLRVCTGATGFAKTLCFNLSNYLADFHIWISVYSCPRPSLFTHTQRLSVCLLQVLGYACVGTLIISQMDDRLPFELGVLDVSAVSVTTGVLSVVAVLPGATMISFLFRLDEVRLTRSEVQRADSRKTGKDCFEDALSVNDSVFHLSWIQQWIQETWRKKYQGTEPLSVSTAILQNKGTNKESVIPPDVIIREGNELAVESSMGRAPQDLSLIPEGKDVDQATEGKEFELLSESGKFHGAKNGDAERSGQSSGYHVIDRLKGRRVGPTSQWCHRLAWALCLLLSLSCLGLSAVLGTRFSSSEVLLWIHSLFFSLMFCIFLIQPAVVLTVAVAVSFCCRKRPHVHTSFRIKEFDIEASKLCGRVGASRPEEQLWASAFPQQRCSYLQKLLAARQRARYLRLVRPPAPAELRKTRGRKRRETLIRHTLRDLCVCVSMGFLMLCITHSSSFTDHYRLNTAVRKQFTSRNDDSDFMSIQKHEDWWKWTQTSLLKLLYNNASARTQRAHILIGEPVLWKTEASMSSQDQVSGVRLIPERLRSFLSRSRTSAYPRSNVMVPTATPPRTCGHLGCYPGPSATLGLGPTKSDAASKLNLLHSGGWLDRRTVALKVQFTLFSPAPNLFTSVTLLTEQSPTSVLLPSCQVQSVRVFRTPAAWDYVVMVCQLLFLLMSLLQLCHQVCTVRQQGLMGYWRKPCNWLEVALLTVTLVHYVYFICRSIIVTDVAELLQRHKAHVDVSFLAAWEQDIRCLRGATLFLLTMKCVTVLRANRTLVASAALLSRSISSLLWPTISGLILTVALSCAGNLLFVQSSWAFSSIPRSLQTLLRHYWGLRPVRGLLLTGRDFLYCGALHLSSTVVWGAVVLIVVSSLVRSAKRSQSRCDVFTVAELAGYIRRRISEFTGQREPTLTDNHEESRKYYLEEFESLVDELLFRLDALSNSLHHTLPPKAHRCLEEESPVTSPIQEPSNMGTQDAARTQMTEETAVNDHTDVSGHGETLRASHLPRSRLELETMQFLQQRSHHRNNPLADIVLASDNLLQTGTRAAEQDPNDRKLQTYLRGQKQSASLARVWTEDVQEKKASKTQATHTEVVVEVLVHKEPGGGEPEK